MYVVLTIDFSPWSDYGGGAQRSTHNLAKALCRRGHRVSVVYTKPPWEHVRLPDDLPYQVHWAFFHDLRSRRAAPLRPLNAFSVARVVRRLIERGEEVVVHSNGEEGGMVDRLRPRHRFRFVATPRHPRYPQTLLDSDRLSRRDLVRLALTDGKYLMQGRAARRADVCAPPSAFAADLVRRAYKLDSARLRVVHNGVPEEFLPYRNDPEAARQGPVVFFGRFEHTKGADILVEALGQMGDETPHTLLIGRGPDRGPLVDRIVTLGLDRKVKLLPWMTHDELAAVLTTARLAVLPSREENFSLAVLSAMAVGAPVISTRIGGTPEIIDHERTGLLVEPGSPRHLADGMGRLLRDHTMARGLAEAGRKHVRTHLTWDVAAEAFEAVYQSITPV